MFYVAGIGNPAGCASMSSTIIFLIEFSCSHLSNNSLSSLNIVGKSLPRITRHIWGRKSIGRIRRFTKNDIFGAMPERDS